MKYILSVVFILASAFPSAAAITSTQWGISTNNDITTYTYKLTSGESGDWITAFHVYAPILPGDIVDFSAPTGWLFTAEPDSEEEGLADIYWKIEDGEDFGLGYGQKLEVSFSVPSTFSTMQDYKIPGFLGNWGFESYLWEGWGVTVMFPPVPVPYTTTTAAPEPCSLAAVGFGILFLRAFRKK